MFEITPQLGLTSTQSFCSVHGWFDIISQRNVLCYTFYPVFSFASFFQFTPTLHIATYQHIHIDKQNITCKYVQRTHLNLST